MLNILVCINDGLLKIRIKRILSEKNYKATITDLPVKRSDLSNYDMLIIHSSYRLTNLYGFIENTVLQKLSTILYITSNVQSNPFRKLKEHANMIFVDESKLDVELQLAISLHEKYKNQIKSLSVENEQLSKSLLESKLLSQCKRVLMQKDFTEEEAHKYILKYAMDNHIDKIEACNRLLKSNSI